MAILVNEIHKHYFEITSEKNLPIQVISSNADTKTYHQYISDTVKFKKIGSVDIYRIDYRHKYILGRFQRYDKTAEIWISSSLNPCWSRYVSAKEMSHLLVDSKQEAFTTDIHKTVTWMLRQGMTSNVHASLDSEHIAAQFAAEMLVPYKLSQPMLRDTTITSYEIAKIFSVPERIIDVLRSNGYLDDRDKAYKDLDIEHEIIPA